MVSQGGRSGLCVAQVQLGYMYDHGQGVTKDDTEALKWYRKAADQGSSDAKLAIKRLRKTKHLQ